MMGYLEELVLTLRFYVEKFAETKTETNSAGGGCAGGGTGGK